MGDKKSLVDDIEKEYELEVLEGIYERKRDSSNNNVAKNDSWKMPLEDFTAKMKTPEELQVSTKSQRLFYKNQNELVQELIEINDRTTNFESGLTMTNEEAEEAENLSKAFNRAKTIAVYGSLSANVFLLVIKIIAAILSGSLSVLASAVDSFLDIFSGAIMSLTEYLARKSKLEDYPAGTSRFEPVGIVIFSACMFTATFQLLLSSVETLITQVHDLDVTYVVVAILATTIALKFVLWMYCRLIKGSEIAQTLAMDHRNDVISNIFGAATALIGNYWKWWVDPIGAILISSFLMSVWARNGYAQLSTLLGKSASPKILQTLTFVARNHHPDIIAIDTVRAYHYGYNYLVELDIVLPRDMPLQAAHDIGESLQYKLECLDKVERAFVHLDYETSHTPEHRKSEVNLVVSRE